MILEYRHAPKRNRRWIIAIFCGIIGGLLIAFSGFLIPFAGMAFGFLIGAVSAFISSTRRFRMGILGTAICVITVASAVSIMNWFSTFPTSLNEFLMRVVWTGVLVGLPGLCGSGLIALVGRMLDGDQLSK